MSDVKQECGFVEAWVGACKEDKPCRKHAYVRCGCGSPAVETCGHTSGLVCGRPLCADCICNH